MGRKGSWFASVKKALSSDSKRKKDKKEHKSKRLFGKGDHHVVVSNPLPHVEDVKLTEVEDEQTKHAHTVAVAAAAAAEVVGLTSVSQTQFSGLSREEVSAIKIQTAFRGYLARRALQALRGLVRLKSLVDGATVKRQTANTLKCMQTLSRMQSQIQSRRVMMLEENRALQRQILQKRTKELECLKMGDDWDDSLQSKEKIEANLLHKYEAAMRRERALAYSYTHQQTWKKSAKSANLLFMDPANPHWGWSWLERWMAARPWDSQSAVDKDININRASIKSSSTGTAVGELTKSFIRHQLNSDNPPSPVSQKPPNHPTPSKAAPSAVSRKLKPPSPRGSVVSQEVDSRSMFSAQSELYRRHSVAGSSFRDDERLPSYMVPTQSTKAKSRLPSPLGMDNGNTPEKVPAGSAKKRLSFPATPRRHSGPPKLETGIVSVNNVDGLPAIS